MRNSIWRLKVKRFWNVTYPWRPSRLLPKMANFPKIATKPERNLIARGFHRGENYRNPRMYDINSSHSKEISKNLLCSATRQRMISTVELCIFDNTKVILALNQLKNNTKAIRKWHSLKNFLKGHEYLESSNIASASFPTDFLVNTTVSIYIVCATHGSNQATQRMHITYHCIIQQGHI